MIVRINPNQSINSAIEDCYEGNTLVLGSGEYHQKVVVKKKVSIVGEGAVVSYDDYAHKIHADGKEFNTFRTYTMLVAANGVHLEGLTIQNTAGNPKQRGQAVALHINASEVSAKNCILKSLQDTLFCGALPQDLQQRYMGFLNEDERFFEGIAAQRFENCQIQGSVDFIFGCGEAVFENCGIVSLNDGREVGYVAAPAHSAAQQRGFVFRDCSFTHIGVAPKSVYLARPWRDYGMAHFIDCSLGEHISPTLFDKWNDSHRDSTARFFYRNLQSATPLTPAYFGRLLVE